LIAAQDVPLSGSEAEFIFNRNHPSKSAKLELSVRWPWRKRTPKGYGQQKFYLGADEAKAELASLNL
jgi:hypothetical protein